MNLERRRPRLRKEFFSSQPGAAALHTHGRIYAADCGGTRRFNDGDRMPFYRRNLPHIEEDGASYYVSFSARARLHLPEDARTLIFEHCLFENGSRVLMHAFVVMPDHVHMLFTPLEDREGGLYKLAKIMNSIKGVSSHSVNKLLGRKGVLWEPEPFDQILRSEDDFEFRLNYIVQNPVVAGLAEKPEQYRWLWRESPQPRAAALQK